MRILNNIISGQMVPPIVYHYTSTMRFTEIIEMGCLFAVSIRYIKNDVSFVYTIDMITEELKKEIRHQTHLLRKKGDKDDIGKQVKLLGELIRRLSDLEQFHIFIVSFTQDGDAEHGWRDYCRNITGCSIGFDTGHLSELAKRQGFMLSGCCHNKQEQEDVVKALIAESLEKIKIKNKNTSEWLLTLNNTADQFATKAVQLAALFKHPHCCESSEWRLIAMPSPILPTNSSMQFMENKSVPAPYLKFMLPDNDELTSLVPNVIIGPTPDRKLSRSSLELFLSARKLHSCLVHYSRIPYS